MNIRSNTFQIVVLTVFILSAVSCKKDDPKNIIEPQLSEEQLFENGEQLARTQNSLLSLLNSTFSALVLTAPEEVFGADIGLPLIISCPTTTYTPPSGGVGAILQIDYGLITDMCTLPNGIHIGGQVSIQAPSPSPAFPNPGLQNSSLAVPAFFDLDSPVSVFNTTITADGGTNPNNRPKFFKIDDSPLTFLFRVGNPYNFSLLNNLTAETTTITPLYSDSNFLQVKVGDSDINDLDYDELINSTYDLKLLVDCAQEPIYTQMTVPDGMGGSTDYNVVTDFDLKLDFAGCPYLRGGQLRYFTGSYNDCNLPNTNIFNFITFGVDEYGNPTTTCSPYVKIKTLCNQYGGGCISEIVVECLNEI